jgi:hypothetical protein
VRISSLLLGAGLGGLLAYFLWNPVSSWLKISAENFTAFIIIFAILGVFLGVWKPTLTEVLSFVFNIFVFISVFWDLGAGDWNKYRTIMLTGNIGLFIFNLYTGKLRQYGIKHLWQGLGG